MLSCNDNDFNFRIFAIFNSPLNIISKLALEGDHPQENEIIHLKFINIPIHSENVILRKLIQIFISKSDHSLTLLRLLNQILTEFLIFKIINLRDRAVILNFCAQTPDFL